MKLRYLRPGKWEWWRKQRLRWTERLRSPLWCPSIEHWPDTRRTPGYVCPGAWRKKLSFSFFKHFRSVNRECLLREWREAISFSLFPPPLKRWLVPVPWPYSWRGFINEDLSNKVLRYKKAVPQIPSSPKRCKFQHDVITCKTVGWNSFGAFLSESCPSHSEFLRYVRKQDCDIWTRVSSVLWRTLDNISQYKRSW